MSKTHWKKLHNPDYFGAYCMDEGKDMTVTIESVATEEVPDQNGKKEPCTVARLKGQKPLILNVTNAKMIEKLTGSPYIEDWKGVSITLYVAKVKAFGDVVDAVRVRSKLPQPSELKPNSEGWHKAVEAVRSGKATVEQVKEKYPGINLDQFNKAIK